MPRLVDFNAADHTYSVDGAWAPGCTRMLADMGYVRGAEWFTEESRIRGRQVHLACQWADMHAPEATTLDEVLEVIDVAPAIHPYLAGFLMFKRETGYQGQWWERPMCLSSPLVAGTPDSWGRYRDGKRVLLDLKSWASQGIRPKRSAQLQVAGYELMVKECLGDDTDLRVILKLSGDNKYRAYPCTDQRDKFLFQCLAHVWHDRNAYKLIEGGDREEVELVA